MAGFPTGKRADLMQLSGTIPVTIVGEIQAHNIDTNIKPYDTGTYLHKLVHTYCIADLQPHYLSRI